MSTSMRTIIQKVVPATEGVIEREISMMLAHLVEEGFSPVASGTKVWPEIVRGGEVHHESGAQVMEIRSWGIRVEGVLFA